MTRRAKSCRGSPACPMKSRSSATCSTRSEWPSASASMGALMANKSWARPHSAGGARSCRWSTPITRCRRRAGSTATSRTWRCGCWPKWARCRACSTRKLLAHDPRAATSRPRPSAGGCAQYLERLGDAWYGYGWRSYDYAGHRIVGHRGGINGYRSLILFDPSKKSGVVALWNSNTSQPGGLEFEVMDMVYHLPIPRLAQAGQEGSRAAAEPDGRGRGQHVPGERLIM